METRIEYGIRWSETPGDIEVCDSKEDAEQTIHQFRIWEGVLVSRTITVGDWE